MAREEVATCPDCRTVRMVRPWTAPDLPTLSGPAAYCEGTAAVPPCEPLPLMDLVLEASETFRVREDGALIIVAHEWSWDFRRSEMWCYDCRTISDYCRAREEMPPTTY